jgi:protein O-GlcNAc transferase
MNLITKNESKQADIDSIISLYSSGELKKSLEQATTLIKEYPEESILFNIQGACFAGLGQPDEAVKSYEKAIILKPDYAKAYYNLGGILHEIGNLDESVNSFNKALNIEPNHAEAHNNLGNVLRDLGEFDEAVNSFENAINIKPDYIEAQYSLALIFHQTGNIDSIKHLEKVITLKPNFAEAYNILGVELKAVGQLNEAVKSYKKAIEINQNYAEAYNNLGNVLMDLDLLNDAVQAYKSALAINPDIADFHNNLGNTFRKLKQLDEAAKCYQNALSINPLFTEAYNNRGISYYELGKLDDALISYKKAIEIDPSYAEAHNNLGTVFKDLRQFEDAIKFYEKALKIKPNYADAHNNHGVALKTIGQLDKAIFSYKKALEINPNDADTHNNLGNVQSDMELTNDSINSFKKAISINPSFAEAYNNLSISYMKLNHLEDAFKSNARGLKLKSDFAEGYVTQGRIFSLKNKLNNALKSFEKAHFIKPDMDFNLGSILQTKMKLCDWDNLQILIDELVYKINDGQKAILPMDLLSLIDDPELQFKSSQIFANFEYPPSQILLKIKDYPRHSIIKIGYFSADFKDHPVSNLTAELYELHDRSHFEIHAFSFGLDTKDEMNLRIKAGVDFFHDVQSFNDKDIVLLTRSIEIDIAVDLSGYTAGCRTKIFSMRAAPIQASYIGLLSSMGAEYYDYLIAGDGMIPEQNQKYFTEKIVYLPSYQVNDSKETPPDINLSRQDVGLPDEVFVFCCFNNTYKITPTTFDSWARILDKTEGSVLLIYANNKSSQKNLTQEIILRGIDPQRLIFGKSLPRPEYLARYRVADLFLDTWPYNAGTTASDALRMGLPVLTLIGNAYPSRMAASILNAVNLKELITNTQEEYETLAIEFAQDPIKLKKIREKLLNNLDTAPLYDAPLFTKNIESAYKQIYQRYYQNLKPKNIIIEH